MKYLASRGFLTQEKALTNPLSIQNRILCGEDQFVSGAFFYIQRIDENELGPENTKKAEGWARECHEKHKAPGQPMVVRFVLTEDLLTNRLQGRVAVIQYDLQGVPHERTITSLTELEGQGEIVVNSEGLTPEELGELNLEIARYNYENPEGAFIYSPWAPPEVSPEGHRSATTESKG